METPPKDDRKALGNLSEDLAARHLEQQGLEILARNFQARIGELDLVARDGPTLVFVEVRSCRGHYLSGPELTVTVPKQRRVILAAQVYLALNCLGAPPLRFDVVAVDHHRQPPVLRWIRDAFRPQSSFHEGRRRRFSDS